DREDALGPAADNVQAGVGRDLVQPRAQRAPSLEPRKRAPGPEQRFLQRVLGVVHGAEHPVAMRVKLALVLLHEPAKGVLAAGLGGGQQLLLLRGRAHASRSLVRTRGLTSSRPMSSGPRAGPR